MPFAFASFTALAALSGQALDGLALLLLGIGAFRGGYRGLTGEIARILATLAAIAAGVGSLEFVHRLLKGVVPASMAPGWQLALALCAVLLLAAVVAGLVHRLVERLLRLLVDQPADAVFGVVIGSARSALLIVALLFLASLWPQPALQRALFEQSVAGSTAAPAVQWLRAQVGDLNLSEPPGDLLLPRSLPRRPAPSLPEDEPTPVRPAK